MSENEVKITTIQLSPTTRDRIRDLMMKSETYDDFLNKILDEREK